jgi:hypothetical protein
MGKPSVDAISRISGKGNKSVLVVILLKESFGTKLRPFTPIFSV